MTRTVILVPGCLAFDRDPDKRIFISAHRIDQEEAREQWSSRCVHRGAYIL